MVSCPPLPHPRARKSMRTLRALAAIAFATSLGGCANIGTLFFKPYRFEIQQGNFVSSEMVALLKAGMTRDQVRFTLGSPMVAPVFRADQWDYVFYQRKTSGEIVERKLSVYFENDRLARWEGDPMPSELPKPGADAPAANQAS